MRLDLLAAVLIAMLQATFPNLKHRASDMSFYSVLLYESDRGSRKCLCLPGDWVMGNLIQLGFQFRVYNA